MATVDTLAKKITDASSLSIVSQEVVRLAGDVNCEVEDLANAISKDPTMASKLIKMANSSFFGFFSKASTISDAVKRLGLKRTRDLALSFGVGNVIKKDSNNDDSQSYSRTNVWCHSVAASVLCDTLAKHSTSTKVRQYADEAFLAGLVHDIGIILADQHMHKRYRGIPESMEYMNTSLIKAESQFLGFCHTDLGAAVLTNWKFSEPVTNAVAGHHNPGDHLEEPLTLLLSVGEYVLSASEYPGFSDLPQEFNTSGLGDIKYKLDIMGDSYDNAISEFHEKIPEIQDIFMT